MYFTIQDLVNKAQREGTTQRATFSGISVTVTSAGQVSFNCPTISVGLLTSKSWWQAQPTPKVTKTIQAWAETAIAQNKVLRVQRDGYSKGLFELKPFYRRDTGKWNCRIVRLDENQQVYLSMLKDERFTLVN